MNAPVQPGEVLAGKYQVERVLGEGGMGVVVAGRDALDRFAREARTRPPIAAPTRPSPAAPPAADTPPPVKSPAAPDPLSSPD